LANAQSVLDYGCGNAEFAAAVAQRLGIVVEACDIDPQAVAEANVKPGVRAFPIAARPPSLPLEDGLLAAVTCCDVLEHIGEGIRGAALAEINRVLADDGALILTTPHRGLFSLADPENLKFHAPRLHRLVYKAFKSRELYERNYGGERLGNYSGGAERHRHFSAGELRAILGEAGFEIEQIRYFTLLYPFLRAALWSAEGLRRRTALAKPLLALCWRLYIWDADLECGRAACSIAVRARKARTETRESLDGRRVSGNLDGPPASDSLDERPAGGSGGGGGRAAGERHGGQSAADLATPRAAPSG
jgi:SAM-dependent methyltransferase